MKENIKIILFNIFRFLFIILLALNAQNKSDIYYSKVVIFISFELFGIFIFYRIKKYIAFLEKTVILYLMFCFFLTTIISKLGEVYIEYTLGFIIVDVIILILISLIYSIIKKNGFYFIFTIVELLWFIFFLLLNFSGLPPELGEYKLDAVDMFLAYIVISCLYLPLFKKNESKKVDE